MKVLNKKSTIRFLQPVDISTDDVFEDLQDMRLQEAFVYAEAILKALEVGEIVQLEWELHTKKGESYRFSFQGAKLSEEEISALADVLEEGIRASLSPEEAARVLEILPFHAKQKEGTIQAARDWVLEHQENFYFTTNEQMYIQEETLQERSSEGLETLPEIEAEVMEEETPEIESEAIIEGKDGQEEELIPTSNLESFIQVDELGAIPITATGEKEEEYATAYTGTAQSTSYFPFPKVEEELGKLFSAYESEKEQDTIFERRQKREEQKEVAHSKAAIKEKILEWEAAAARKFAEEKKVIEAEINQHLEEAQKSEAAALEAIEAEAKEKKEANEIAIEQKHKAAETADIKVAKQNYEAALAEIQKEHAKQKNEQLTAAEAKIEQWLAQEKQKIQSDGRVEQEKRKRQLESQLVVTLEATRQTLHQTIQQKLYQQAAEAKQQIEAKVAALKPMLDAEAKHELEEWKLKMDAENEEKHLDLEREFRFQQLEQEKEVEEKKIRASRQQQADILASQTAQNQQEWHGAMELVKQMSALFPANASASNNRMTIPETDPAKSHWLKPAVYCFTAVLCTLMIGLGIMFGFHYLQPSSASNQETRNPSQTEAASHPDFDSYLRQKDYMDAAAAYPERRNEVEQAIYTNQDATSLEKFNQTYTTDFGALDEAILKKDTKAILYNYEKDKKLHPGKDRLEAVGAAYAAEGNLKEARAIQKVIQSDQLHQAIQAAKTNK